ASHRLYPLCSPTQSMKRSFEKVIIVGAGPSGLLLALLLSQEGIPVHVLEASHELDTQPRAAYYGSPAIPELKRAGLLDEVRRRGLSPASMEWRRSDSFELIARLEGELLSNIDGVDLRKAGLVLDELNNLMLDRFLNKYNGKISWRHRVIGTGQTEDQAWVNVEIGELQEQTMIYGDYIVGCDGGRSTVRKSLFGDEFPGFTWNQQIVATNVYYDFSKYGFEDLCVVLDPDHFFVSSSSLVRANSTPGTFADETPKLSARLTQDGLARQPLKYKLLLPGRPEPDQYKLINLSPYKMHQRCAPSFRKGRILLAADAAHLCNPFGGLGITGGFVDIGGLSDCLAGIWNGRADESILDLYSAKRMEIFKTVIDPVSQSNFRRASDGDAGSIMDRDTFLQACKKAEGDECLLKDILLSTMAIRYDFTQHYH
ncbi:FAD/NAD(P)-binding domain-containing protein, partial [Apiospora rasikravindrae]